MSKNKKIIAQSDLRRLMGEMKKQNVTKKKIESPLARYDKGQLTCIVCETTVDSEAVWPVHLNSKKHRENFSKKFKRKENVCDVEDETVAKKPAIVKSEPSVIQPLKGILKNAPIKPPLPVDFFTAESTTSDEKAKESHTNENVDSIKMEDDDTESKQSELPEGFFDDPKLDAKVRNVEYKDPIEEEWQQFQKAIKEESTRAQDLICEDQEEATNERQIDEIDEQLRHWSRVLSLEKKKESIHLVVPVKEENEDEQAEDEDFDEYVDWRSKKSFLT